MEQFHWDTVVATTLPPTEAIKLIRKLRWVGLEAEARQLRDATRVAYREQAGVLAQIPYETD
jgi:hypothetical protein